jgi:hypothetical protein
MRMPKSRHPFSQRVAFGVSGEAPMTGMSREGLTDSITYANDQLKRARQDGGCDQIRFWAHRLDQLLDELSQLPAQ